MTSIDTVPKFSKEETVSRSLDMARLLITHLGSKIGFGEYFLDYFTEEIQGRGEINHIQVIKKCPGMFTPGVFSCGTKILMDFAIWTKEPEDVVYHGYGPWGEIHAVLTEFIWRHWVIVPMLCEITNKLAKSGTGKLSIKTAEDTWEFKFTNEVSEVKIIPDKSQRKSMSFEWDIPTNIHKVFATHDPRELNILIYSMLRQQGLV